MQGRLEVEVGRLPIVTSVLLEDLVNQQLPGPTRMSQSSTHRKVIGLIVIQLEKLHPNAIAPTRTSQENTQILARRGLPKQYIAKTIQYDSSSLTCSTSSPWLSLER